MATSTGNVLAEPDDDETTLVTGPWRIMPTQWAKNPEERPCCVAAASARASQQGAAEMVSNSTSRSLTSNSTSNLVQVLVQEAEDIHLDAPGTPQLAEYTESDVVRSPWNVIESEDESGPDGGASSPARIGPGRLSGNGSPNFIDKEILEDERNSTVSTG